MAVISENARRLCGATLSAVYRTDGKMVYDAGGSDVSSEMLETANKVNTQEYPAPLDWDTSLSSRCILSKTVVHIPNMEDDADLPEMTRRFIDAKNLEELLYLCQCCVKEMRSDALPLENERPVRFLKNRSHYCKPSQVRLQNCHRERAPI